MSLKIPKNYLSMHCDCSELLCVRVEEIRAEDLEVSLDRVDIRIKKMVRDVLGEVHRLKAALHEDAAARSPAPEALWQVYYDSQYCPERKNLSAFRKNMPRRDQESAGLRLVQNKRSMTFDDFF